MKKDKVAYEIRATINESSFVVGLAASRRTAEYTAEYLRARFRNFVFTVYPTPVYARQEALTASATFLTDFYSSAK